MRKTVNKILDIIFPPKCPFCGKILSGNTPVCHSCMSSLPFIDGKSCRICGRPVEETSHIICRGCRLNRTYFEHAFIPLIYKDKAKDAVLALKAGHPYYAKGIAYVLADKIINSPHYASFDLITFVPQDKEAFKKRGYNQAELIAKEVSRILNIPCVPTLRKTTDGKPQHTLNLSERRENVKKCFFATENSFSGTALLIDDIYTTGATSNYCSKLLRKMGFEKVYLGIAMIRTDD